MFIIQMFIIQILNSINGVGGGSNSGELNQQQNKVIARVRVIWAGSNGSITQEKLSFYISLRKNYSQNGLLSSGGSRGGVGGFFGSNFTLLTNNVNDVPGIDGVLHTSELVVGSAEIDQITFKTFISGSKQYQVVHRLFISPQSLFIITYNPMNINSTMINYWLNIIQAKGSSIYLVGLSNTSMDEKLVNFKVEYHRLFRFNNINSTLLSL
ncbi:hypothetical protein ACTFIU_009197 [Dictyostelium citrinum]